MRYAAARGALSVSVEYRLAVQGGGVHRCIDDCAAAMLYLREHAQALGILPHKICVCGESAGGHLALCLGTEGDGLADATIAACDFTVRIPMHHGVDSLNVAAASAVAFYQLGRRA